MTPIDFSNLEKLSKTINEASDEVSRTLAEVNEKLNALNLGSEVFLDSSPNRTLESTERADGYWESAYLGYSKLSDSWGLVVKFVHERQKPNGDWDVQITGYKFLLDSSRNIRIKALELVPELLKSLESKAEELSQIVSKGKQIAEEF